MDSFTHTAQGRPSADPGSVPFIENAVQAARNNQDFRRVLWTGNHLQLTVMCVPFRGEVGLELHSDTDQLIRVEEGHACVRMGPSRERMDVSRCLYPGDVILIPRGTWHNVVNTGNRMLKLSSVYAPPQHPQGTVHRTKANAQYSE